MVVSSGAEGEREMAGAGLGLSVGKVKQRVEPGGNEAKWPG